jgi:outer membrane immunogenic protein
MKLGNDLELEKTKRIGERKMKKALLTAVSLVALGMAPALAADLPARTYTKAPVAMAPIYNWTGFYLGAMGGYGKEDASFAPVSGGFAGGTIGYNWQQGALVFGLEADAAWSDMSATAVIPGLVAVTAKVQDLGTVRGRIGYAFDQVLIYGTGGYAWADTKLTASVLGLTASESHVLDGWTAGAGVEVMFAPKWSLKAEYLYRSFGGTNYFTVPSGTLNMNSVQVGVNYHF